MNKLQHLLHRAFLLVSASCALFLYPVNVLQSLDRRLVNAVLDVVVNVRYLH